MAFLLKHCDLRGVSRPVDVRLTKYSIGEIGENLEVYPSETVIEAGGAALLPGLHDHHIHLVSLAASLYSVPCGPPQIQDEAQLVTVLASQNNISTRDWMRGIGYHPCVAGDIDRHWLDRCLPDRPARIQHRGGRLWVLNSAALDAIGLLGEGTVPDTPEGIERVAGAPTGRLYECDLWLREQLGSHIPDLGAASQLLASYGVTGLTDATPRNGQAEWQYFAQARRAGPLLQDVRMMGSLELANLPAAKGMQHGEFKVHLLESQLPKMESVIADIRTAHETDRSVAIHCVTLTELVFAIACLESAGIVFGDRIEHASVCSPDMLSKVVDLGLRIVSQPHFVAERGDQYLSDVEKDEQPWLYRLQSLIQAGIPLAGGSDAPFGSPDPWEAMSAAVTRKTSGGFGLGADEALTPEQALALYTSEAQAPGLVLRDLKTGATADLCLLDRSWSEARSVLDCALVRATWQGGELIYRRE